MTVLEALTVNSNPEPFIVFARKLIEMNSHIPFGSFEQSLVYFKKSGALDEQPQGFGFLPAMLGPKT